MQTTDMPGVRLNVAPSLHSFVVLKRQPAFHSALRLAGAVAPAGQSGEDIRRVKAWRRTPRSVANTFSF